MLMKKILFPLISIMMAYLLAMSATSAPQSGAMQATANQPLSIKPTAVEMMPDLTMAEFDQLEELAATGEIDVDSIYSLPVYSELYSGACSWYCGGWVDTLTASSHLGPQGHFTYEAKNAHDFDHESVWATKGYGIGEYLTFTFDGNCPRITSVAILNGHVKTEKAWRNNSRVKSLLLYYNDSPYRLLELEDSRSLQYFDVDTLGYGPSQENAPKWTLKFEIKEVYPGEKYDDTVIAEFLFDGIDVH